MSLKTVLETFRDGNWHYLPEVAKQFNLDNEKAGRIFSFLAEYKFIEIGESGLNGRLEPSFSKSSTSLTTSFQPSG